MLEKDKQLLFKDLCARLPYEPKARKDGMETSINLTTFDSFYYGDEIILPYLRPLSSMTEEERLIYEQRLHDVGRSIDVIDADDVVSHIDWLLERHFDFRGLIPMGLALEAPKGMYN
jgi:hypothetical protein